MKSLTLLAVIFIAFAFVACTEKESNPVLTIEGGQIQGVETEVEGIVAYKGVPFAAPPVGELRWREPQPVVPWEGVKIADTYGDAASQTTWDPESFYGREWQASGTAPFTEDCLYLNIWTPAAGKVDEKLPVAMWIHGGGYREGFSYEPEMDGGVDYASRGVILVQVTYRLGILGFFSHPLLSAESPNGVSGNYGVMDQAAALKWIHDNIDQFGGDPDNIMIFGQSAGGGSVQTLLASPKSRDYVAKAISMSAGGLGAGRRPAMPFDTVQNNNKKMMDYFDISTLDEMRSLSFDSLTAIVNKYGAETRRRAFFSPLVENYFLTGSFSEMAQANEIPDIPYMFGFTANDMNDMTKAVADFCLLREEQSDQPAYAYLFSRQLPGDDSGAFHSSDLWYVFHSFEHSWRPFTAGDEALSLHMVDCWTNFAKYGDPNGKDGGEWTPYTKATPEFMVFDADDTDDISGMTDSPEFLGGGFPR